MGLGESVAVKEYIVELGRNLKPLVVILEPKSGYVAFVNAIEVVSLSDHYFPMSLFFVSDGKPVGSLGMLLLRPCVELTWKFQLLVLAMTPCREIGLLMGNF